jgi:hypothetical protein
MKNKYEFYYNSIMGGTSSRWMIIFLIHSAAQAGVVQRLCWHPATWISTSKFQENFVQCFSWSYSVIPGWVQGAWVTCWSFEVGELLCQGRTWVDQKGVWTATFTECFPQGRRTPQEFFLRELEGPWPLHGFYWKWLKKSLPNKAYNQQTRSKRAGEELRNRKTNKENPKSAGH